MFLKSDTEWNVIWLKTYETLSLVTMWIVPESFVLSEIKSEEQTLNYLTHDWN